MSQHHRKPLDRTPAASSGFTLVELLVVLGVIAILLSLLLPVLGGAAARGRATACAEKLRGFGVAISMYANGNDGLLVPPGIIPLYKSENWAEPVLGADVVWQDHPGGRLSDALVCPSDPYGGDPDPDFPTRNSYLVHSYFIGYRYKLKSPPSPWNSSDVVVIGEKRPDAVGYSHTACYSLSVPPPLAWYDHIDLVRHGRRLRSNHLYFDLHVDNRDVLQGADIADVMDPWPCWDPG